MDKLIAITGGLGCGKTSALNIIRAGGFNTISCDNITKELYTKQLVLRRLKKHFPAAITGKFILKADRREIARVAFSDAEKYARLAVIVSFPTLDIALKRAKKMTGKVFVEVPLLLEFSLQKYFDKTIVIKRKKETRITSVKIRSHLTEEEIKARMDKQFDFDNGDLSDYVVIENDTSFNDLRAKVLSTAKTI